MGFSILSKEKARYIYSPECRLNCHQFLIVFSSSLIAKARHLLSVTIALHIYFIAFWWCNCMHCQSAWSKSPLRLKSLSSCPQKLIFWKTQKGEWIMPYFPCSNFWTAPLKPRQNKFISFRMHTETPQTQVLMTKENTSFGADLF